MTDVDKGTGKLSMESQGKEMDLHLPPAALEDIDRGDEVTVQLAIRGKGPGSRGRGPGNSGSRGSEGTERSGSRGGGGPTGSGSG